MLGKGVGLGLDGHATVSTQGLANVGGLVTSEGGLCDVAGVEGPVVGTGLATNRVAVVAGEGGLEGLTGLRLVTAGHGELRGRGHGDGAAQLTSKG